MRLLLSAFILVLASGDALSVRVHRRTACVKRPQQTLGASLAANSASTPGAALSRPSTLISSTQSPDASAPALYSNSTLTSSSLATTNLTSSLAQDTATSTTPPASGTASTVPSAAGSCVPNKLAPKYAAPVIAAGWSASLLTQGLTKPRSLILDTTGHLLVVQSGVGISRHTFAGGPDCDSLSDAATVVADASLNHGIQLSSDGKTLYASNSDNCYAWDYADGTVSNRRTVVRNMAGSDHTTRTLLLSQSLPGRLIISRGSTENIDAPTAQLSNGRSQIRHFDASGTDQDWMSGTLVGWGLRNSVGIAEHPKTGGLFSVENSADQITRGGVDIHNGNPGEEMNYHGSSKNPGLNGGVQGEAANFGYPNCFAAWDATNVPNTSGNFTVGTQFSIDGTPAGYSAQQDNVCQTQHIAPRLTFEAHNAPLDIVFTSDGSSAYYSSHGSWDNSPPVGYRVGIISFGSDGMPTEPSDSKTAVKNIFTPANYNDCPSGCARPAGMLLGPSGQLMFASDATGEIWVIRQNGGNGSTTGTITGGTPAAGM